MTKNRITGQTDMIQFMELYIGISSALRAIILLLGPKLICDFLSSPNTRFPTYTAMTRFSETGYFMHTRCNGYSTFTHSDIGRTEKCSTNFLPYNLLNHRTVLHHPLQPAAVGR
jgi:hypothetical protein